MMIPIVRSWIGLLALSAVVGCSNGLASVEGTVTLDGQPIVGGERTSGTVSFVRDDGGGAPAVGFIDERGRYALKTGGRSGVEPGSYLVSIAVKTISPPEMDGGMPRATLITPRRYASVADSGLRETVEAGNNSIDFQLSSK